MAAANVAKTNISNGKTESLCALTMVSVSKDISVPNMKMISNVGNLISPIHCLSETGVFATLDLKITVLIILTAFALALGSGRHFNTETSVFMMANVLPNGIASKANPATFLTVM